MTEERFVSVVKLAETTGTPVRTLRWRLRRLEALFNIVVFRVRPGQTRNLEVDLEKLRTLQ